MTKLLLGACPIVYPCLREYIKSLNDDAFGALCETETWDELLNEAKESAPTPQTVRLRAFYAIELVYTQLLPMQFFAASMRDVGEELKELRIPRTESGVQLLRAEAEKRRRNLIARVAVAKLKSQTQMGFALSQPAETFERLSSVCDVLAGCLRRRDLKGMTIVGEHLGWSFRDSSQPELEVEGMVRHLLTINPQRPLHPWEVPDE